MSSSVSYAYTVRQEALRRAREEQAARDARERERRTALDALRAAERRYEELRQEALDLREFWGGGIEVPRGLESEAESASTATLHSAQQAVESTTAGARTRLGEQIAAARVAAMEAGMEKLGVSGSEPIDAATAIAARRAGAAGPAEERDVEAVETTIARLLARLEADVPAEQLTRVEDAADAALAATAPASRELALDALRVQVGEANTAAVEARRRTMEIDRLEAGLDGYRGPDATAMRRLLSSLRSSPDPLPPNLGAQARAALEAEGRRSKADYVHDQLGQALTEMGYEVGPEFTTALASGGALATRAGWPGYGVAVNCSGDPPRLELDVVRGEGNRVDQASRDLEVERAFCASRPALLDRLARAGIDASQAGVVEEGTAPLRIEPALTDEVRESDRSLQNREMDG